LAAFKTWLERPDRGALAVTAFLAVAALGYAGFVIAGSSTTSFYVIDDPYIHLALAENLARGHFGVNFEEYSNPSSSILWPWLMAGFQLAGAGVWAPLIVNLACFLASGWVIAEFVLRVFTVNRWTALAFAGLLFLSVNLFGVVFTGLEHSLHVLVSLVAITRLVHRRYDDTLMVALILSPLIRFEGAAILALGLVAALIDGRWRFAAIVGATVAAIVALYVAWLASLGLPALPSSVLVKSDVSASLLDGVIRNFTHNLQPPASLLSYVALGWAVWRCKGQDRLTAIGVVGFLTLALAFGPLGGYPRYEVYVFSTVIAALIWLLRWDIALLVRNAPIAVTLGVGFMAINSSFGWHALTTTPQAARNIDQQQHQMHRFAADCWKKPVAVNDLGWVAYRNPSYVLDLWGLASEEARLARKSADPDWMARLAAEHHADAALIYSDWFRQIPATWTKVGQLRLTEPSASPAGDTVDVYATRAEAAPGVAACLGWLQAGLPQGAEVRLNTALAAR
jgi:hypothetical protein